MKPTPTNQHEPAKPVAPQAQCFLDALREEQVRYLDAVRAAGAAIRDEPGELPLVAAIHTRLAQQLFDAQRAILQRQASIDALVRQMDEASGGAGRDVGAAGLFPPPVVGAAMARAELLDAIRDDAFDPVAIDPMLPQHELAELLERWWERVNVDGRDMVDRARARARLMSALTVETTAIEPRQDATTFAPPQPTDRRDAPMTCPPVGATSHRLADPIALPVPALDSVSPPGQIERHPSACGLPALVGARSPIPGTDLQAFLSALAHQLQPTALAAPVRAGTDLEIRLERWEDIEPDRALDRLSSLEPAPRRTLRRSTAAADGSAVTAPRDSGTLGMLLDHVLVRTLLPMVAVTTALVVVMALVG